MGWITRCVLAALAGAGLAVAASGGGRAKRRMPYRSPAAIVVGEGAVYVADATANSIEILRSSDGGRVGEIPLEAGAGGLALARDGSRLYAVETGAGALVEIDPAARRVLRRAPVGRGPTAVALAERRGRILVANRWGNDLAVVDATTLRVAGRVPLLREPISVSVTPDERLALVANALPTGPIEAERVSASLVRLDDLSVRHVPLPIGSTNARGTAIAPEGRFGYIAHALGRYHVPPTQIERGWINNSCLSIVDLAAGERVATLLLDHMHQGAGDPWAVALTGKGSTLWISLAGTHRLARLQIAKVHRLLEGELPPELAREPKVDTGLESTWLAIRRDRAARDRLTDDLAALAMAQAIRKIPSGGKGPRALAARDGRLYAAHYFSGTVTCLDPEKERIAWSASVGDSPEPDAVRRGEIAFHDADTCFQRWQSCATCHPEGRSDGLRWDLLNDGMGNPKKTRSLVGSYATSPVMALGIRDSMETAVRAGYRHILFAVVPDAMIADTVAYLRSLEPVPSPVAVAGGGLTESARRGKAIFEGPADCARCHAGPLGMDQKAHDVGTRGELDREGDRFYTPKLQEVWRTAPYLHDGRARTLEEVLRRFNPRDEHGKTSQLSDEEIHCLVEYLQSL